MQRDMDLIRQVVLSAEAGPPFPNIDGYTEDAIKYHKMLAIEAGLLKGAKSTYAPNRDSGRRWFKTSFGKVTTSCRQFAMTTTGAK